MTNDSIAIGNSMAQRSTVDVEGFLARHLLSYAVYTAIHLKYTIHTTPPLDRTSVLHYTVIQTQKSSRRQPVSLRWIQNAALGGLIGGTILLTFGMAGGGIVVTLLGIILGTSIGIPAALYGYHMQGYRFEFSKLRGALQDTAKQLTATVAQQVITQKSEPQPARVPATTSSTKTSIPVAVEAPAPTPKIAPRTQSHADITLPDPPTAAPPEAKRLSHSERQALIDLLKQEDTVPILMGYANHEDDLVRLYAVQRLGTVDDPIARDALQAALNDPADVVKRAARLALDQVE